MLNLLFLFIGFFPLIYGADMLVDGASSFARRFNIPNIVIGLTIVAFGTSAPELVVNVVAASTGAGDISLGNVLGSNVCNVLGILGASALVYPLAVRKGTLWMEIPLCILSAVLVLVLANDRWIDGGPVSLLSRTDGLVLLFFFLIFLVYNVRVTLSGRNEEEETVSPHSLLKSVLFIVLGLVGLGIGGKMIVVFATRLAEGFGISERVIAITIVSIGTSLPELATSLIAARKKNVDIAVGNIVGSNLFNTFLILGVSAVIRPIGVQPLSNLDMLINLVSVVLLFVFVATGKKRRLERWAGGFLVGLYVLYLSALVVL